MGALFEPAFWTPLAPGEVHLWRVRLDVPAERAAELARVLEPDELARAGRMRFELLRRAAVASAAGLRRVLAPYCALEPEALRFRRGPRGKPALRALADAPSPRFNLAHSGALALVAVSAGREVGVDLEVLEPARVDEPLAERVLSPRELGLWRAAPAERRAELFLAVWTHKEALMKATGLGLGLDPLSFEVLLAGEGGAPVLATAAGVTAGEAWTLQPLDVGSGYAAALALEGRRAAALRCFDLEPARTPSAEQRL